jgi:ABC-2 type transport system permease protein
MGMTNSSSGLREDLRNGLVDRFQSLPIPRWSAVVARSVAELCTMLVGFLVLAGIGYAIGWRIHDGLLLGLAAIGLLLLFGYLMVWLGMLVTVLGRNPESGSGVFMLMMPLLFVSNAFVPLDGLPGWVRTIAEWNPFSAVVLACRQLWGNPSPVYTDAFPTQHPVIVAIALPIVALALIIPVTVRRYQSVVSR